MGFLIPNSGLCIEDAQVGMESYKSFLYLLLLDYTKWSFKSKSNFDEEDCMMGTPKALGLYTI